VGISYYNLQDTIVSCGINTNLTKFPSLIGSNVTTLYYVCVSDPQSGSSDVNGRFDPNAVYAQVDKNKKRSTRKSGGGKDDFTPMQHAPYPVDEPAGGDSWV